MSYTDNELVDAVRQCATGLGAPTLTIRQYKLWQGEAPKTRPSASVIVSRFGWRTACQHAGLEPSKQGRPRVSDIDIVDAVRRCATELDVTTLRIEDYQTWREQSGQDAPTAATSIRRGGWSQVCAAVGVKPGTRGVKPGTESYSNSDLVDAVRVCADDLGVTELLSTDYMRWRETRTEKRPSRQHIDNRIGWREACRRAGVTARRRGHNGIKFADYQMVDAVEECANDLGVSVLSGHDYVTWAESMEDRKPAYGTICHRLGWLNACEQAGVDPQRTGSTEEFSDDDLIEAIRDCATALGVTSVQGDVYTAWRKSQDRRLPSIPTIANRAGWNATCERAGLDVRRTRGKPLVFSDDDLIEAIRDCATALGVTRLSGKDYETWVRESSEVRPSRPTIDGRLGWGNACRAAGINSGVRGLNGRA